MELVNLSDSNYMLYTIPECSSMELTPWHSDTCLNILDGAAQLYLNETLNATVLNGEIFLPSPHIMYVLTTSSGCTLRIRGKHKAHGVSAPTEDGTRKELFTVCFNRYSFNCNLNQGTKLHIFVDDGNDIGLSLLHGKIEVLGCILVSDREYDLPSYFSYFLDSSRETCSLKITGENRKIKIIAEKGTSELQGKEPALLLEPMSRGSNILVIGEPNVGKTSVCYCFLNKALERGMRSLYVNLNVSGNVNFISRTMGIFEVTARSDISGNFWGGGKTFFFGFEKPQDCLALYYLQIKRLSELFRNCMNSSQSRYSGAVIEMSGFLSRDLATSCTEYLLSNISYIVRQFGVDRIVVIGNLSYLTSIEKNLSEITSQFQFIPAMENIVPRNLDIEKKIRINAVKRYFFGTFNYASVCFRCTVKISYVEVFKIIPRAHSDEFSLFNINIDDVRAVHVLWDKTIEGHVLGVIENPKAFRNLAVAEISYFIYIEVVDIERHVCTVISPRNRLVLGAVLMMGNCCSNPLTHSELEFQKL